MLGAERSQPPAQSCRRRRALRGARDPERSSPPLLAPPGGFGAVLSPAAARRTRAQPTRAAGGFGVSVCVCGITADMTAWRKFKSLLVFCAGLLTAAQGKIGVSCIRVCTGFVRAVVTAPIPPANRSHGLCPLAPKVPRARAPISLPPSLRLPVSAGAPRGLGSRPPPPAGGTGPGSRAAAAAVPVGEPRASSLPLDSASSPPLGSAGVCEHFALRTRTNGTRCRARDSPRAGKFGSPRLPCLRRARGGVGGRREPPPPSAGSAPRKLRGGGDAGGRRPPLRARGMGAPRCSARRGASPTPGWVSP